MIHVHSEDTLFGTYSSRMYLESRAWTRVFFPFSRGNNNRCKNRCGSWWTTFHRISRILNYRLHADIKPVKQASVRWKHGKRGFRGGGKLHFTVNNSYFKLCLCQRTLNAERVVIISGRPTRDKHPHDDVFLVSSNWIFHLVRRAHILELVVKMRLRGGEVAPFPWWVSGTDG